MLATGSARIKKINKNKKENALARHDLVISANIAHGDISHSPAGAQPRKQQHGHNTKRRHDRINGNHDELHREVTNDSGQMGKMQAEITMLKMDEMEYVQCSNCIHERILDQGAKC